MKEDCLNIKLLTGCAYVHIYVIITERAKCYEYFYILQKLKILVFECTCCFDVLPGQCFCWVSRPHIQNETVLLWSTKGICEGQEKYTNII